MNKKFVITIASVMALTSALSACSLTGNNANTVKIDPNKTQVYVSAWNGGFGLEWLHEAVARYNAASTEVQVIVNPNKDIYQSQIAPAIEAGISSSDIFITAQAACQDLGIKGYLEDLSDIWATDVDGNGKTVEEKMIDAELFKKVYQTATGTWGLPHSDAMQGFVYDHGIFADRGWLMTESDGVTLTKGKDGIEGTYDDGQPVTMAEWDLMVQRMVADTVYPFLWTGMKATDYLTSMGEALLAQYDGLDNYKLTFSYDGVYTHADGTQETITPATGYKTIKTPAKKVVMDFVHKYLIKNANYYHPSAKLSSVSHQDAQNLFVLGYKNTGANPQSGMLYEGVWWENEARPIFKNLEKRGEKEYTYGTRDYRYMLFPNMDGQRGANGDGTGSVIGVSESGTIFLKKMPNEEKRAYAKDFIKYLVSDEVSRLFTTYASGLRPYAYELTAEDEALMTTFAKNAYELYSDTKNVTAIRLQPLKYLSEMNHMTSEVVSRWGATMGDIDYKHFYTALCNATPEQYYAGMDAFSAETYWQSIYEKYLELQ